MTDALDVKEKEILKLTIKEYIDSGEPISSARLSNKGVSGSSSTIRNKLNTLEKKGYLTHTHTSSGRVPTDIGYRVYVDGLMNVQHPSSPEEVQQFVNNMSGNIKDIFNDMTRLMSSLLNYTTIVLTPNIFEETLKVAHLVMVDIDRIFVVLLNASGLNHEFILNTNIPMDQEDLNKISQLLSHKLEGQNMSDISPELVSDLIKELPRYQALIQKLCSEIDRVVQHNQPHLLTDGVSKMIKLPEFQNIELTQNVLTTLEENKVLMTLLQSYLKESKDKVVIGNENMVDTLKSCSLVVSPYQINQHSQGLLGVLGPTRMTYSKVIPMVKHVSNMVSQYLNPNNEKEIR